MKLTIYTLLLSFLLFHSFAQCNPIQTNEEAWTTYLAAIKTASDHPDATANQLKQILNDYPELPDSIAQQVYYHLNKMERVLQNFSEAFEYADMAYRAANNTGNTYMLSLTAQDLGDFYKEFGKEEISHELLYQNLQLSKQLFQEDKKHSHRLTGAHFHLAKHYRTFSHYDLALAHLDSCEIIGKANGHIRIYDSYHRSEQAQTYADIGKIDTAQIILHELDDMITPRLNDQEIQDYLKGFLSVINLYLGDTYLKEKTYRKAIYHYQKAWLINDQYKLYNSQESTILENLGEAEFSLENYKQAYISVKKAKELGDKTFGITSKQNNSLIEIRSKHRIEIEEQKLSILEKDKMLAEKSKRILIIEGILIGVFLILIISYLFYRNRKQKLRYTREKALTEKKRKEAENALETKNKELTAFTLKLIDKEETIDELISKLKEGKTDATSVRLMEKRIKSSSTALWDEFNSRFIEVNSDFYERLQTQYPDLSKTERKHCALIKLNFSGKEMAHLLGITVTSVHVSRYRLRKRFALEKSENLTDFISKI